MWITVPDNPSFTAFNTLTIQFFSEDRAALQHDPWLEGVSSSDPGEAVVVARDGGFYLHQGLVTMWAVKSMSAFDVLMRTWDWLNVTVQEHERGRLFA
ncbi:hypothetical protein DM02DRAFT_665625 [Periconia macrospinosa]|uniref:Uncharacterized protein n=1 Tax=Periconia macrospinosa TaxID=97972 RepID=A0A2V1CX37_9PLEO|nr:hypothetical protein DM02DRAFT_665625 [Periconia macrospinosa]